MFCVPSRTHQSGALSPSVILWPGSSTAFSHLALYLGNMSMLIPFLRPFLPDTSSSPWHPPLVATFSHSPYAQDQILQRPVYAPCLDFLPLPLHFWMHQQSSHPHNHCNFTSRLLAASPMKFHSSPFWTSSQHWPWSSLHTVGSEICVELMNDQSSSIDSASSLGYPAWPTLSFAYPKSPSSWSLLTEAWFCLGEAIRPVKQTENLYSQTFYKWNVGRRLCPGRLVRGKLSWCGHFCHLSLALCPFFHGWQAWEGAWTRIPHIPGFPFLI